MRSYEIRRTEEPTPLSGDVEGTVWETAEIARIDSFTWSDGGPRPETTVRALHDDDALFLQFQVEDDDISAEVTELNGPTFRDSSVEFFANPTPELDPMYVNFEANCCGTFKLAWQEYDWRERDVGRETISTSLAREIDVETSVDGPTRTPTPEDESWWLATRIPVETLQSLTGRDVSVESESVWRGNFYRSGVPDEQKATWNPLETAEPMYHSPECFGRIEFA